MRLPDASEKEPDQNSLSIFSGMEHTKVVMYGIIKAKVGLRSGTEVRHAGILANRPLRCLLIQRTSCWSCFPHEVTGAAGDLLYGKCLQGQCWKKHRKGEETECGPCGKFIRPRLCSRVPQNGNVVRIRGLVSAPWNTWERLIDTTLLNNTQHFLWRGQNTIRDLSAWVCVRKSQGTTHTHTRRHSNKERTIILRRHDT